MKNLILFISFFTLINPLFSQSNKQLVRSIRVETNTICLEMDVDKEIQHWESAYIKMEIHITSSVNQTKLDNEVSSGKFDIIERLENNIKKINFKNSLNNVIEKVKIKVYLPKNTQIINTEYI